MELSDKAWQILEPLMPALSTGQKGRPWRENREVLDGILWVLRTGAPWRGFTEEVSAVSNVSSSFSTMVFGWHT